MLSIAEVDFEVVDCHCGAWGVEFAGTVVAADTGKVLILDLLVWLEVVRIGDGGEGFRVHGGVAHHTFE